jgi:hypothetical protein
MNVYLMFSNKFKLIFVSYTSYVLNGDSSALEGRNDSVMFYVYAIMFLVSEQGNSKSVSEWRKWKLVSAL